MAFTERQRSVTVGNVSGSIPSRKKFTPPGKERHFHGRDLKPLSVIDDADGILGNRVYAEEVHEPKTRKITYKILEFPIDPRKYAFPDPNSNPDIYQDLLEKNAAAEAMKNAVEEKTDELSSIADALVLEVKKGKK